MGEHITLFWMFQSTFPRGERREHTCRYRKSLGGFNPRSREGNDSQLPENIREITVSIHVPARGTTERLVSGYKLPGFNPRSREGNDFGSDTPLVCGSCFNPRSREGNDAITYNFHL